MISNVGRMAGAVLTAAVLLYGSTNANAAYVQGTCSVTDVTAGGTNAAACLNYSGNDTGFVGSIAADFDVDGLWYLAGKSDSPGDFVMDIGGSPQSGNWSLASSFDALFVVVLKAANFYAAYLFDDVTDVTGGSYDVSGVTTKVHKGQPKPGHAGLSHISVYAGPQQPDTDIGTGTSIPEAAGLSLFGLGLAGLGFVARRRHRS